MLAQFLERAPELQDMLNNMNNQTRLHALGFCGIYDDQAFGTEVHYNPQDINP